MSVAVNKLLCISKSTDFTGINLCHGKLDYTPNYTKSQIAKYNPLSSLEFYH